MIEFYIYYEPTTAAIILEYGGNAHRVQAVECNVPTHSATGFKVARFRMAGEADTITVEKGRAYVD